MSSRCEVTAKRATGAPMSVFERYLTLWVFVCIVVGIVVGQVLPGVSQAVGRMEFARVNLPVGVLIWVMIIPMLVKVDFTALHEVRQHVRGIGVTLFVNWLVKPFSMALLAWIFIRHLFAPWLPAGQIDSYVAGLILLAAAPCTAMVFVWSRLSNGDPMFTLTQVALNDAIMVVAFAPLVGLLLGIAAITVPWDTLVTSVVLYIVIPVVIAQLWRRSLLARGQAAFDAAMARIGPWSIAALLLTLVLLAASVTDLRDRVVPNRLTLAAAIAGLALAGTRGLPELGAALAGGALVAAPLAAVSLARPAGLGMGDVKLVAVLGIFMGWQVLPALLGGCLLAGLAGVLISLGSRRPPSEVALPLVPFLALGTLSVVVWSL